MPDYVLEGPLWGVGAIGSGVTVTWAVDANIPAAMVDDITAAFSDWSVYANISFQQVASTAEAQISLSEAYIDGLDNILGQTDFSYIGQSLDSASIVFDSGESWHTSGGQIVSDDGVDFFMVALHEIGHSVGLDHNDAEPSVMNSYIDRSLTDLTASDIDGIQALYGSPSAAPTQASADASYMDLSAADLTAADMDGGSDLRVAPSTTSALASVLGAAPHDAPSPDGQVHALYEGLLGRAPDTSDLQSWGDALKNGTSQHDTVTAMLASPEFQAHANQPGGGQSSTAFVENLYEQALGRHSDASELQAWTDALAHGISLADVAVAIADSTEAHMHLAAQIDQGWYLA